jgi:site-specific DNA-adenine methylase
MRGDKLSFLKYPGSKLRFVDLINIEITKLKRDVDTYCEPFLGSGAVFLNLPFEFNNYYLSDFDRNILKIWEIFSYKYEELLSFYEKEILKYGNPGRQKDVYFKIRDELNSKYFLTDAKEEAFYLFCLSRNVINSILRFGKKGINQGWGNRGYDLNMDLDKFNLIKKKIDDSEISQIDVFEVLAKKYSSSSKTLLFLDPPYVDLAMSYKGEKNYKVDFDKSKYLQTIKSLNSFIIYTDVYDQKVSDLLNWRIVDIRTMKKIRPGSKSIDTKQEVMYINF